MGIGRFNPLPFRVGGGQTGAQRAYRALRSAVGTGGAGPENGLEDCYRMCEARAIASAHSSVERAMYQMWPQTMTDNLTLWERALGITPAATLPERQAAVRAAMIRDLDATIPGITAELAAINPALAVDSIPWLDSATVQLGRMFGPLPGVASPAPYSSGVATRDASSWPNYSDAFILRVVYTLPSGVVMIPQFIEVAANEYLNEVLPSWVDFDLYTLADGDDGEGFYLDGGDDDDSLLDQTAFD